MTAEERRLLADLERHLAAQEPALAAQFDALADQSSGSRWGAFGVGALLLTLSGALLAVSVHWRSPLALIAAIVVFSLAGLPLGRRPRPPRRRS